MIRVTTTMCSSDASATQVTPEPSRAQLLEMCRLMHLARATEERLELLFRQGHVHGGVYRSLGQEGAAVGTAFALRARSDGTGDVMTYLIRDTGAIFTHGGEPIDYLRHYLARATSLSRGRETGVHFTDFDRGLVGPISHLGTMVEVMAGMTWAFRLRGEDRVGMAYLGDGGSSTGEFHEGLNFAAVQECPMVMVLEANGYAFSTPTRKQTRAKRLADKAVGYGIPGESVDGNDVVACYEAAARAVARARAGHGASLLEVVTYRRRGHAQHDAQDYVPPEELEHWASRDPIDLFEQRLLSEEWATPDELEDVAAGARTEAERAADEALAEPLPEGATALDRIYTDVTLPRPWTRLARPDPHDV
ncbi:MAG: thiamine pyrophosphate-dependent dehydrogenase E1 component subunit alpha [Gemmatimonadota bacterium]|nr:thiamine pyrophosphate-dependent dehydrogenase E1 component subunit alpha [Gemmatimonadota bacterium]